jgi:hypothetical protein
MATVAPFGATESEVARWWIKQASEGKGPLGLKRY